MAYRFMRGSEVKQIKTAFWWADAVTDHVDQGTLVTDYPGVTPIACLE